MKDRQQLKAGGIIMANKRQNTRSLNTTNQQALQGSLDDAEKALAGDPLQEAVRRKKSEQQFNM